MELLRLLVSICDTYLERKNEKDLIKSAPGKVTRGTIVSVSGDYENEMAKFRYLMIHKDYNILVDYRVTLPGRNNRVTPDILIIKDDIARMIIELKIDLGYESVGWQDKKAQVLSKLHKYGKGTYQKFDFETNGKKPATVIFPEQLPYATIILCQKNGKRLIEEVIDLISSAGSVEDEVPYFI